jgi:hypothetical protein
MLLYLYTTQQRTFSGNTVQNIATLGGVGGAGEAASIGERRSEKDRGGGRGDTSPTAAVASTSGYSTKSVNLEPASA